MKQYDQLSQDDLVKVTDPRLPKGYAVMTKRELEQALQQGYRQMLADKTAGQQRLARGHGRALCGAIPHQYKEQVK